MILTHMQHERNGLHLDGSGFKVASAGNVSPEVRGEVVVLIEVRKRGHSIRDV